MKVTGMSRCKALMLGMLIAGPVAVTAQTTDPRTDPRTDPASTQQPMPGSTQSQTTPGVRPSATPYDSSASGGAGNDLREMKDRMFLRHVAQGGLAEVKLGQLAAERATNEDVKKFAQKMADDHTRINVVLQRIADDMGVDLPTKISRPQQMEYEKLNALSGTDFDKEYLTYETADHHRDLRDFHDEANSAGDANLKDVARVGERVIARHTKMVEKLDAANGVSVAAIK